MFEEHTATVARPSAAVQTRAAVAPHPMPAPPRAGKDNEHEPTEAVRASVDRLIDQANRFNQQNRQETPDSLRATFQFD